MKALPPGNSLGDDQPEIVEVVEDTGHYSTVRYIVRLPCCGRLVEKTHSQLLQHLLKNTKKCRDCYCNGATKPKRKRKPKPKPIEVPRPTVPTWPAPPSVTGRGILR